MKRKKNLYKIYIKKIRKKFQDKKMIQSYLIKNIVDKKLPNIKRNMNKNSNYMPNGLQNKKSFNTENMNMKNNSYKEKDNYYYLVQKLFENESVTGGLFLIF